MNGCGTRSRNSTTGSLHVGKDWLDVLEDRLGLEVVARLGAGGRDYGSRLHLDPWRCFEMQRRE